MINNYLAGKNILITRPAEQISEIRDLLVQKGANVLSQPTITISQRDVPGDPPDFAELSAMIFSSSNGVRCFFGQKSNIDFQYEKTIFNLSLVERLQIFAVGPGTSKTLREYGLQPGELPNNYCAEGILEILEKNSIQGKKFLLVRGTRGRDFLAPEIIRRGGFPVEWIVYESKDVETADPDIIRLLHEGNIDGITITSSAIALAAIRLFGKILEKIPLFSISPRTSETLRNEGLFPAGEAKEATILSLLEAMNLFFEKTKL